MKKETKCLVDVLTPIKGDKLLMREIYTTEIIRGSDKYTAGVCGGLFVTCKYLALTQVGFFGWELYKLAEILLK